MERAIEIGTFGNKLSHNPVRVKVTTDSHGMPSEQAAVVSARKKEPILQVLQQLPGMLERIADIRSRLSKITAEHTILGDW